MGSMTTDFLPAPIAFNYHINALCSQLLGINIPSFENSVDPDYLVSDEAS